MALKPRYKRRILWTFVSAIAAIAVAIIIIPPMITLNNIRGKLTNAITDQTGIAAQINGNVHFSMLGRATIVAHDVVIPNGNIDAVLFSVPMADIFNLADARLGHLAIYGANLGIESLAAPDFPHSVEIYNSTVRFHDKNYNIIRAKFENGTLTGTVRTDDHKYDLNFSNDEFTIKNHDNKLEIVGQLFNDGTARGHMDIETADVNEWFEFREPRINHPVKMSLDFIWDGQYGFEFSDIQSDNFSGNITLNSDGTRDIQLRADDMDFDLSFLLNPSRLYAQTKFNLDLYGHIKIGNRTFEHLKIDAVGEPGVVQITNIIADDITINGGNIRADGAHDIMITMPVDDIQTMCVFYGTPKKWGCNKFTYGDIAGTLSVDGDTFDITIAASRPMPNPDILVRGARRLGKTGKLHFKFSDMAGTMDITQRDTETTYTFATNKTLHWAMPEFKLLPDDMLNATGDMTWHDGTVTFIPHNNEWEINLSKNKFALIGKSFKRLVPNIDLQSVNDFEYRVAGTYRGRNVSDLYLEIAGHTFQGSASGRNITMHTASLNLDTFTNQQYIDNYDELEFLSAAPITIPFELPVNISLSANTLIYNGNEYKNFVYALKPGVQTFSITDSARGSMLAILEKENNKYDISIQLNRFVTSGNLLARTMPVNVRDSVITADISMTTHGHIAHDIFYNLAGDMDLSFDGGYLVGLGFDGFYSAADKINTFNAEYALADALTRGETQIKQMRIVGKYENGDFITSQPLTLQMRHVDAYGEMDISGGQMSIVLQLTLRGTAPVPAPLRLTVAPDGTRNYSLTDIMTNFDSGFMRSFVKTHNQF